MTERKPPGMSVGSWIDRQVQAAQDRGELDDLPGAGKPLPARALHGDTMDWIAQKAAEENLDVSALLPPSLALAKEVHQLPERVRRERTEAKVRALVEDLNERIRQAHRMPQNGPPLRVGPVDPDEVVSAWQDWKAAR